MSGFVSTDSGLFQKLSFLTDLVFLNILTVICSLPVITLGASATALYYSVERLRNGEGNTIKDFFRSFKQNFKQATLLWLVMLVLGGAVCFSIMLLLALDQQFVLVFSVLGLVVWGMVTAWMFPLLSRFYCDTGAAFKNALLCATSYLPLSLAMGLVNLVPLFVFLFVPDLFMLLMPLWALIWFSFAAFCNAGLLRIPMARLEEQKKKMDEEAAASQEKN